MKKMLFIMWIFLLFATTTAYSKVPRCEERETCVIPNICECMVTPSSLDRNFYVNIQTLKRGNTYTCTFKSHPSTYTLVLGGSKFPDGVKYECLDACPHFPSRLIVNTDQMQSTESSMEIKYFVPGFTDIPSTVTIECS